MAITAAHDTDERGTWGISARVKTTGGNGDIDSDEEYYVNKKNKRRKTATAAISITATAATTIQSTRCVPLLWYITRVSLARLFSNVANARQRKAEQQRLQLNRSPTLLSFDFVCDWMRNRQQDVCEFTDAIAVQRLDDVDWLLAVQQTTGYLSAELLPLLLFIECRMSLIMSSPNELEASAVASTSPLLRDNQSPQDCDGDDDKLSLCDSEPLTTITVSIHPMFAGKAQEPEDEASKRECDAGLIEWRELRVQEQTARQRRLARRLLEEQSVKITGASPYTVNNIHDDDEKLLIWRVCLDSAGPDCGAFVASWTVRCMRIPYDMLLLSATTRAARRSRRLSHNQQWRRLC
jgi:hypothetical protein